MESELSELAIVLATYNEADNLSRLVHALEELGEDLHIVVVDDNSPDGTQQIAREMSAAFGNITVVGRPGKQGLGSALRDGVKTALATGSKYIMMMDADYSHDPLDVPRLLEAIRIEDADMVQGSRYVPGGGVRGWGPRRWLLSRGANLLYHWFAGAPNESTTTFRVHSRRAASVVAERTIGRGYRFIPEATLVVMAAGMDIVEAPIIFTDRVRGTSKLQAREAIKHIVAFFVQAVQYRLHVGRFARRPAADIDWDEYAAPPIADAKPGRAGQPGPGTSEAPGSSDVGN